jgi:hypothetical protein
MSQSTMIFLLVALQVLQLIGFGAGFVALNRKVQLALNTRAVSLRKLALSASSGERALALSSEVQAVNTRLRRVEDAANRLFLASLLANPGYSQPVARAA